MAKSSYIAIQEALKTSLQCLDEGRVENAKTVLIALLAFGDPPLQFEVVSPEEATALEAFRSLHRMWAAVDKSATTRP